MQQSSMRLYGHQPFVSIAFRWIFTKLFVGPKVQLRVIESLRFNCRPSLMSLSETAFAQPLAEVSNSSPRFTVA